MERIARREEARSATKRLAQIKFSFTAMVRNKILYIFCLVCLLIAELKAQDLATLYRQLDSIEVRDTSDERRRLILLDKIIESELHRDYKKGLQLMDEQIEILERFGDKDAANKVRYKNKGFLYATHGNTIEALRHYEEYAKFFERKGEGDGYFLIDVGNIYFSLKLFGIAQKYYQQAEEVFDEIPHYKGLGTVYCNYALIAGQRKEADTALFYLNKAMRVQQTKVKDSFQLAHTYMLQGSVYNNILKDYASAGAKLDTAIGLLSGEQLKRNFYYEQFIGLLPEALCVRGQAFYKLGDTARTVECLDKAWLVAVESKRDKIIALVAGAIGFWQLEDGKYQKAIDNLYIALNIGRRENDYMRVANSSQRLSKAYEQLNKQDSALVYAKLYHEIRDTLDKRAERFLALNDEVLQYEYQKTITEQEKLIAAEQKLSWFLRIIIALSVSVVLLLLVVGIWSYQKNKVIAQTAKDLALSNAVKERVLLVIGHDLRSIFNVVMGSSQGLQHQLREERHQLANAAEQVHQSAKKAYMLMDSLMQWGTLQRGNIIEHITVANLSMVIEKTINPLQPILDINRVDISVDAPMFEVLTDANLLQIILRNLLTNAIKYSPSNGLIVVRATAHDDKILLAVEDSGGGIEDKTLQTLFEHKNRVSIAQKGSGLGLEIVKDLCDKLNIILQVSNKPAGGAIFTLVLPTANRYEQAEKSSFKEDRQAERLTDKDKGFLSAYALRLQNHEVFEASSIQQILAEVATKNNNAAVSAWLQSLRLALLHNDEAQYQQAIAAVLGDK
jgi:signal transduction histidine kinase